jgi:hypothetical protein
MDKDSMTQCNTLGKCGEMQSFLKTDNQKQKDSPFETFPVLL